MACITSVFSQQSQSRRPGRCSRQSFPTVASIAEHERCHIRRIAQEFELDDVGRNVAGHAPDRDGPPSVPVIGPSAVNVYRIGSGERGVSPRPRKRRSRQAIQTYFAWFSFHFPL